IAVAATFDLSYRDLPAARQRFFRRLGLHLGTDLDAYAGAALDNITVAEARDHLEALYGDHLIDQPARGRYRMHDLIRDYAHILCGADPVSYRNEAIEREMDYYQYTAYLASSHIGARARAVRTKRLRVGAPSPAFSSVEQASAWMSREMGNLFAC